MVRFVVRISKLTTAQVAFHPFICTNNKSKLIAIQVKVPIVALRVKVRFRVRLGLGF
jgi:hypothetical protein